MSELTEEEELALDRDRLIFHINRLDEAGLHRVLLKRGDRRIECDFDLENPAEFSDFVQAGVDKLKNPVENLNWLRRQIESILHDRLDWNHTFFDHPQLETMSEAMFAELEWLWPEKIAAGKLTMLVGDPGIGKSLVALDVAARVSTGRPWPDEPAETQDRAPGGVLLLAETDDSADTLQPRLEALGADLERVVLLRSFVRAGAEPVAVPFSIAGSLTMLEACIRKVPDCRLVILDPLSVYLNGNRLRTAPAELIANLIETAVKLDVAILVVSHVSRSAHGLFNYRSPANYSFAAAARTIWSIYADREQANRRLFAPMKNNVGRDTHGLAFRIEVCEEHDAPHIVWENTPLEIAVEKTMLASSVRAIQNTYAAQREFASNWLRNQLLAGERLAREIVAAARLEKIAEKSLRRALREIGGTTQKGPSGHYVWLIPDQSRENFCDHDYELSEVGHDKDVANLAKLTNLANLDSRSRELPPTCDLESEPVFP